MKLSLLLLCMLAAGSVPLVKADEVYVSSQGADVDGCGSIGNPCLTLNFLFQEAVSPGTTIVLASGTYSMTGPVYLAEWNTPLAIKGFSQAETFIDFEGTPGFVYDDSGVIFSMELLEVRNAYNPNSGGAIRVPRWNVQGQQVTDAQLHLDGVTFNNCSSAIHGGAVFWTPTPVSRAIVDSILLSMNNVEMLFCSAGGCGGGIYMEQGQGVVLGPHLYMFMCSAVEFGGGLFSHSSLEESSSMVPGPYAMVSLSNDDAETTCGYGIVIDGCTARLGGGMFLAHQADPSIIFVMRGVALTSNYATQRGGGIYFNYYDWENGAPLYMEHVDILGNFAGEDGGGVYVDSGVSWDAVTSKTSVNVASNYLERSGSDGGNVYCVDTVNTACTPCDECGGYCRLTPDEPTAEEELYMEAGTTCWVHPEPVYIGNGPTAATNSRLCGHPLLPCKNIRYALECRTDFALSIEFGLLAQTHKLATSTDLPYYTDLTIAPAPGVDGDVFLSWENQEGPGFVLRDHTALTVRNVTLTDLASSSEPGHPGGFFYMSQETVYGAAWLTLDGVDLINGNSDLGGAGIYARADGATMEVRLHNSRFRWLNTKASGGALYLSGVNVVEITDCYFDNCNADNAGGVLWAQAPLTGASSILVANTTFRGAVAGVRGGCIALEGPPQGVLDSAMDATLDGVSVLECQTGGVGGGLWIDDMSPVVGPGGMVVRDNFAVEGGAGMWCGSGCLVNSNDTGTVSIGTNTEDNVVCEDEGVGGFCVPCGSCVDWEGICRMPWDVESAWFPWDNVNCTCPTCLEPETYLDPINGVDQDGCGTSDKTSCRTFEYVLNERGIDRAWTLILAAGKYIPTEPIVIPCRICYEDYLRNYFGGEFSGCDITIEGGGENPEDTEFGYFSFVRGTGEGQPSYPLGSLVEFEACPSDTTQQRLSVRNMKLTGGWLISNSPMNSLRLNNVELETVSLNWGFSPRKGYPFGYPLEALGRGALDFRNVNWNGGGQLACVGLETSSLQRVNITAALPRVSFIQSILVSLEGVELNRDATYDSLGLYTSSIPYSGLHLSDITYSEISSLTVNDNYCTVIGAGCGLDVEGIEQATWDNVVIRDTFAPRAVSLGSVTPEWTNSIVTGTTGPVAGVNTTGLYCGAGCNMTGIDDSVVISGNGEEIVEGRRGGVGGELGWNVQCGPGSVKCFSCNYCPAPIGRCATSDEQVDEYNDFGCGCPLGSEDCSTCVAGGFGFAETWGTGCTQCEVDTASDGTEPCNVCGPGSTSSPDRSACAECLPGTFEDEEFNVCSLCGVGFVAEESGAEECDRCPAGTFANSQHDVCSPCPDGTSEPGSQGPQACTSDTDGFVWAGLGAGTLCCLALCVTVLVRGLARDKDELKERPLSDSTLADRLSAVEAALVKPQQDKGNGKPAGLVVPSRGGGEEEEEELVTPRLWTPGLVDGVQYAQSMSDGEDDDDFDVVGEPPEPPPSYDDAMSSPEVGRQQVKPAPAPVAVIPPPVSLAPASAVAASGIHVQVGGDDDGVDDSDDELATPRIDMGAALGGAGAVAAIAAVAAADAADVESKIELETPLVVSGDPQPERFAVLIGVNKYDGSLPNLENPVNDVRALARRLVESFGFLPDHVLVLENPTMEEVLRGFKVWLKDVTGTRNGVKVGRRELLVFWAGHAVEFGEKVFLAPTDFSHEDPSSSGLNLVSGTLHVILEAAEMTGHGHVLLVFDVCHSGTVLDIAPYCGMLPAKLLVLASCRAAEEAVDESDESPEHSPYAAHLLTSLKELSDGGRFRSNRPFVRQFFDEVYWLQWDTELPEGQSHVGLADTAAVRGPSAMRAPQPRATRGDGGGGGNAPQRKRDGPSHVSVWGV